MSFFFGVNGTYQQMRQNIFYAERVVIRPPLVFQVVRGNLAETLDPVARRRSKRGQSCDNVGIINPFFSRPLEVEFPILLWPSFRRRIFRFSAVYISSGTVVNLLIRHAAGAVYGVLVTARETRGMLLFQWRGPCPFGEIRTFIAFATNESNLF